MTPKELYYLVLQKQKEENERQKKKVSPIIKKILSVLEEQVKTRQEGDRLRYHIDFDKELKEFLPFYNCRAEITEALQKELGDYADLNFGRYFHFLTVQFNCP